MYDRGALKRKAKQLIRASKPHFMLVALVYWLLSAGLSTAARWLSVSGDLYFTSGMLSLFLTILVALFGIVMATGFVNYALRLSRQEPAGWNSLFQPFSYAGRTMGTRLLTALFIVLWAMIPFAAAGFLAASLSVIPVMTMGALIVLLVIYYLLVLAMFLAFYLWILRYWMTAFSLADNPEAGAMEHIRRSIRMTNGFQGKLFVLNLSFLGWALLIGLITLLVVTAAVLIIYSRGGFDWVPQAWMVIRRNPTPSLVSTFSTRLTNQLAPWVLLGQVLALPLNLWLTAYEQTALALFYNFVGGYDYHQYMLAHPPQGPASTPPRRPDPPAGGYYTPQRCAPERPEELSPSVPNGDRPPALSPEVPAQQSEVPAPPLAQTETLPAEDSGGPLVSSLETSSVESENWDDEPEDEKPDTSDEEDMF